MTTIAQALDQIDQLKARNSDLWTQVSTLAQRVEELDAGLGRSEDRRYES